jgi:hypothetical protein
MAPRPNFRSWGELLAIDLDVTEFPDVPPGAEPNRADRDAAAPCPELATVDRFRSLNERNRRFWP